MEAEKEDVVELRISIKDCLIACPDKLVVSLNPAPVFVNLVVYVVLCHINYVYWWLHNSR